MGRVSVIRKNLPPETFTEVVDWLRSGRYTIEEVTDMLNLRGYAISKSAVGRFKQQVEGPAGIVITWIEANPIEGARLARNLEANPQGGFQLYVNRAKAGAKS